MANGSGLNVLGLLQHQRQTKKDERDAVTNLMEVFSKEALRGDSDTSYDEGIKLINDVSGKDEYTNLIGDLLVRDLSIEKDHNKKIEAWHQKKDIVFSRAGKIDPSKPTEFLEMLNDLTANGINVSKRANEVEQAQIKQGIESIREYRKQVEGIEGEKVWRAISKKMAPHDADAELLHLGLKADPALQPEQGRSIAFSQYSRKQKVSDAQAIEEAKNAGNWRTRGGIGNRPDADSIYDGIKTGYSMLSGQLNEFKGGNDTRGGTFNLSLNTENLGGAGKSQQDLTYYTEMSDRLGYLLSQMFGVNGNKAIWEALQSNIPRKEGEAKDSYNLRVTNTAIRPDGGFTDTYIQTGIDILERKNEKKLWSQNLRNLFGEVSNWEQLESEKLPMIGTFRKTVALYNEAKYAEGLVNQNINMFTRTQNKTSTSSLPVGAMRPSTTSVDADSSDYGLDLPSDKFNVMGDWDFGTVGSDSLSKY